ncbi:MAG: HD domain-containing phosphohydrolase [Candidatus Paceibacterota bacterium]|jgi:putative nucleotidyltransferase with HDIG domain
MNILIVDDIPENLCFLKVLLEGVGYSTIPASNGLEALELLRVTDVSCIISDVLMPGMDGFKFCRECKSSPAWSAIPFIFYTATYTERKDHDFAMSLGADAYVLKPQEPEVFLTIINSVLTGHKNHGSAIGEKSIVMDDITYLAEHNERLIQKLESKMIDLEKANQLLNESLESLKRTMNGAVQAMSKLVEVRDPYTAGHEKRVAHLAVAIAEEMGLDQTQIVGLRIAGMIHDIGKVAIPAEILSKPKKLTPLEMSLIQLHPQVGFEILSEIEFPWPIAQIVLQHHERLDGSGYPKGLKDDEIIPMARILAVADTVEAMTTHRPYRAALGIEAALTEISAKKGTHYDRGIVEACIKLFREKGYTFPA